tara:strand:+ start:56 stop:940 length:885 start_codon:yes stop_codon:yes gene_type:complete
MKTVRIIPRLDVKGPNLVKGINLEGLRVLGKPWNFARYYYENGADELIFMDVVASLYGRNSLVDIIKKTSKEIFIPLTVGGGLRTIYDIHNVLRAGADKVSLNTAVINNPELIKIAAEKFGSSTIMISIEAIKKNDNNYEAYTNNGRERTGIDAIQWAKQAEKLGAGEIMVTSIDNEGTGRGFGIELTSMIAKYVSIPVIACGGAGTVDHVLDVIEKGGADAVSVASILHYNFVAQYGMGDDFSAEGNIEFLKRGKAGFSKIQDTTIDEIKKNLVYHGISCRFDEQNLEHQEAG